MKQILHIFAKDTRHLWREILISVGLVVALLLTSSGHWIAGGTHFASGGTVSFSPRGALRLAPELLAFLIPLSWWILIAPLIHEERLVGDRQFWVTRPYEWNKLLAAKVAFILVYVYLPLFAAQCLLLARAGFDPFLSIPGLLYNLLMLTAVLILPVVALAAITRNFARMTLVVVGAIVPMICIRWLASAFPGTHIPTPFGDSLALAIFVCGCVAVVLLQYAGRRTSAAWLVLVVALGLVTTLACTAPDQALMSGRYPAEPSPGIELTYTNNPDAGPAASVASGPRDVVINIPIHVSGVAPGSMMISEAVKVTLEGARGSEWTSVWEPTYGDKYFPGDRTARVTFAISRSVYERLKPSPLHARIVLALARTQQGESTTISLPLTEFKIPGFGTCRPWTDFFKPYEIEEIGCRAPLRTPPLTFVSVLWSYDDCRAPRPEPHNVVGEAWAGSLDRPPAEFGIVPVWSDEIGFTNRTPDYRFDNHLHICPGTPATFTQYRDAGKTQATVDIQGFTLPELNQGQLKVADEP
jgi:hypothetical protein